MDKSAGFHPKWPMIQKAPGVPGGLSQSKDWISHSSSTRAHVHVHVHIPKLFGGENTPKIHPRDKVRST